jgi:dihydroorotate dehydrogenase
MIDFIYRNCLKRILFNFDAETVHNAVLAMLASAPAISPLPDARELAIRLWDIDFANPIGLAAGMDKNAVAVRAWHALGFGFAELGTITPRPQPGNPRPRVFRLAENHALINRLGFPSDGMDAVAFRIARLRQGGIPIRLGLNFGPNKETAADDVGADYAAAMRTLGAFADFVVINVSSPNTPGLRNWQSPDRMRAIFEAIAAEIQPGARRPPILIKLAPDLSESDLAAICEAAPDIGFDGIVATNTTLAREEVGVSSDEAGGLSGAPLRDRARNVIRAIYRRCGARIPIVGVGGIASAQDAYGHIRAGASIVELYTGMIYEGPALIGEIKRGLVGLLRRDGFRSIGEAVGVDAR